MSTTAPDYERRVAPQVAHLSADELDEQSVQQIEGRIIVLFGEADSTAIEMFDDADSVAEFQTWITEEFAESFRSESETSDEQVLSAELTYEGRTVVDDMTLREDSSFGVARATFNGGDLDETGFKVNESGEADVEYRVLVTEPTLDEDQEAVEDVLPEDSEGASITVASDEHEICGALAILGGALAGYAAASAINPTGLLDDGAVSSADEVAASVDELIEARS